MGKTPRPYKPVLLCSSLVLGTEVVRQEVVPSNNTVCGVRMTLHNSCGEKRGVFLPFLRPSVEKSFLALTVSETD